MLDTDGLPRRLGAPLADEHAVHIQQGRAQQRGESLLVLALGDGAMFYGVPERRGLEVHLHDHGPAEVLTAL
jgi:hypothetical protein